MAVAKESKFVKQLKRSNKAIRADRAKRIGTKVSNAHSRMCMKLQEDISNMEDEIDAMTDLSTDNQSTSMNVISTNFNADEYVERLNTLKVKIKIAKEKLEIAQDTTSELFE